MNAGFVCNIILEFSLTEIGFHLNVPNICMFKTAILYFLNLRRIWLDQVHREHYRGFIEPFLFASFLPLSPPFLFPLSHVRCTICFYQELGVSFCHHYIIILCQEISLLIFMVIVFGNCILVFKILCNSVLSVFYLHYLLAALDNCMSFFSFLIFLCWVHIATRWSHTLRFWEIANDTEQCENGNLLLSCFHALVVVGIRDL